MNTSRSLIFCFLLSFIFSFSVKAQDDQTAHVVGLETMGAYAAIALYNSYTTIGVLADAYDAGAYEYEYVQELLDEQISMFTSVKTQNSTLLNSGFLKDEDDRRFIVEINEVLELLSKEATSLKSFVEHEDTTDADDFHTFREAAWDKIAKLLGID